MIADEILKEHALRHVAQYYGNVTHFLKVLDGNEIPSNLAPIFRPCLGELKRQLFTARVPVENELLLRYGLVVPGLQRGVKPALDVLLPARGGFSARRVEEAVGQVARLQQALDFCRRFLGYRNLDPVATFRQLVEELKARALSSDQWVQRHSDLADDEVQTVTDCAISYLDDPAESVRDFGTEILRCLADYRHNGLTKAQSILEHGIIWPSSLYRDAPDSVATALINRISQMSGLQLNHALLALAWTRGEPARRAFWDWRNRRPRWAAGLHVPPERYLVSAGWTLDSNGRHRDLISFACNRLTTKKDSQSGLAVPCRKPAGMTCVACGSPLVWLFDFMGLPKEYFSNSRTKAPRRILCCPFCACFSTIFSKYDLDGGAEWHPLNKPETIGTSTETPPSDCELICSPQPPFAAASPFGLTDATSLGGIPMWLQDAEFPNCPDCGTVMSFLAQFDNGSMEPPEEGIYYSFYCERCFVAAVNYQQT